MGVTEMEKKSSGLPFMPFLHDTFLALFGTFWWQLVNPETNRATGSAKMEIFIISNFNVGDRSDNLSSEQ
jgi:hypothetical protein